MTKKAKFFKYPTRVRLHLDQTEKIDKLIDKFPDRFKNKSDVIRSSVNYYYQKEVVENGEKRRESEIK